MVISSCKVTKTVDRSDREVGKHHTANVGKLNSSLQTRKNRHCDGISIPIFIGVFKLIFCCVDCGRSVEMLKCTTFRHVGKALCSYVSFL